MACISTAVLVSFVAAAPGSRRISDIAIPRSTLLWFASFGRHSRNATELLLKPPLILVALKLAGGLLEALHLGLFLLIARVFGCRRHVGPQVA
jgi:hypothetical protein